MHCVGIVTYLSISPILNRSLLAFQAFVLNILKAGALSTGSKQS